MSVLFPPAGLCIFALHLVSVAETKLVDFAVNGGFEMVDPVAARAREDFKRRRVAIGEHLPQTWQLLPSFNKDAAVRLTTEDVHSGRRALQVSSGGVRLILRTFGVLRPGEVVLKMHIKGTGRAAIGIQERYAVGGRMRYDALVANKDVKRTDWKAYRATYRPNPSTRLFEVHLHVGAPVIVDDVQVLAHKGALTPVPDLATPIESDADTLLLVSFDRPLPSDAKLIGRSEVVDARFGKGMRFPEKSALQLHLPGRVNRTQGTVELWVKPDFEGNDKQHHRFIEFGGMSGYKLSRDQYNHVLFHARTHWKSTAAVMSPHWQFAAGWGKGQWHHVAATWSDTVWQIFVDGTLVSVAPKLPEEAKVRTNTSYWKAFPKGFTGDITIGSAGMTLDEIRVSSTVRYGFPADGKLFVSTAPAKAASPPPKPQAATKADVWQPQFPRGDLGFDAGPSCVLADENRNAKMSGEDLGDGVRALVVRDISDMVAWRLAGLEQGRYAIGLVANTCGRVFLNGRPIKFDTGTEPYLMRDGTSLSEWRTRDLVGLRNGDQIRVNGRRTLVRLNLYEAVPPRSVLNASHMSSRIPDYFHLGGDIEAKGDFLSGSFHVHNRVGTATQQAILRARVIDYEQRVLLDREMPIALEDDERWEQVWEVPCTDTWLYRLRLSVRDDQGREAFWTGTTLAPVTVGPRPRMWLNKGWEVAAQAKELKRLKYGAELKKPRRDFAVPQYWPFDLRRREHVGWFKRTFVVPPSMRGKQLVIRFDRVSYECQVYVNRKKVGEHFGPFAPFELDVTDFVQDEENLLEVGVRSFIAALPPDILDSMDLTWPFDYSTRLDAPSGVYGQYHGHCGICGDVYLEGRGRAYVSDVRTLPSYRRKTLGVRLRLNNADAAGPFSIENVVKCRDRIVLQLPSRSAAVARGEAAELETESAWPEPVLWQMEDPRLCMLISTVREGGRVIDVARTRFGFAEWWCDGEKLMLNGTRQKLRFSHTVSSWHPTWTFSFAYTTGWGRSPVSNLELARRYGNANAYRREPIVRALDYGDELGFAARCRMIDVWKSTAAKLMNDTYWRHAEAFAREGARAFSNHPSIAFYEASNEFSCFARYTDLPFGERKACERLAVIHRAIKEEDPYALVESDSDGDIMGAGQSHNLHYPLDHFTSDRINGHSFYFPDCAFWRPMSQPPKRGQLLPADSRLISQISSIPKGKFRFGEKPVGCGETCWTYQWKGAFGASMVAGERAFEDNNACAQLGFNRITKYYMEGDRDVEMAYLYPWRHYFEWVNCLSLPPVAAVPLHRNGSFIAGAEVARDVNLHNDTEQTRSLALSVVFSARGRETVLAQAQHRLGPAELKRLRLTFRVPSVSEATRGVLSYRVDGHHREDLPCAIYPSLPKAPAERRLYLFDPDATLAARGAGVGLVSGLPPQRARGLVVAGNALGAFAKAVEPAQLTERLKAGLKVVVLRQDRFPEGFLPVAVQAEANRWTSIVFPRATGHPVLEGIEASDLRFWAGDHLVSKNDLIRPTQGNFRVIVDSGSGNGLDRVPLMEVFLGKGSLLFCQMLLSAKVAEEPVAAKILGNLLAYAGSDSIAQTFDACAVLAPAGHRLRESLAKLGASVAPIDPRRSPPGKLPPVICAAGNERLSDAWQSALRAHVEGGGTLLVSRLVPATKLQFERITSRKLLVYPVRVKGYSGRLIKTRADAPLLAGLSNHELCWRRVTHSEGHWLTRAADTVAEPIDYECRVADDENASPLFPRGLVDLHVGKGRVVIDQIRWADDVGVARPQADRVACTILTNLGIEIPPVPPRREMPKGVAHKTLDLTPYANRALVDEAENDGKGGWSDQGAKFDMRNLPTGRLTSRNIPFSIGSGPKSCIVLKNSRRKSDWLPEAATIPVGRKVAGLYFVHSGAWYSDGIQQATLSMDYADGDSCELPVVPGQNVQDWSKPAPHTFTDRQHRAWTALTVSCDGFPNASVFMLEWVNPRPDATLAAVRFVSRNRGIPILLSVTLAVPTKVAGAQVVRSMTAHELKQIQALLRAQKPAAARNALEAIVSADPAKVDARKVLARLAWDAKQYDHAEAHYLRAMALTGESVEILNFLGQLNAERKAHQRALDYYRRSLKKEWNQPMAIREVRRLEAALKRR